MSTFLDLGLLILFATIGGVLAIRFRQPAVLGLLLIGAVVGPHTLGLISQSETVDLFANIGAALLLFTIGVEFSVGKLLKLGVKVFLIALFKLAIVFLLSYWLAIGLGLKSVPALLVGVILSITSTAFVVRVLEQKALLNKTEVPILIAALIFEDVFAVFVLAIVSNIIAAGPSQITPLRLLVSILFSTAMLGVAYLVLLRILQPIFEWLASFRAEETAVFASLSLGVGLSYLAELLGLTPSIGAFLAGSLVASLPQGEKLEKAVAPFALLFSSLFFISMGMLVNFSNVIQDAWIILVLLVANLLFKFVGMGVSTYLFGFSSRSAVFAGLAMLSIGEFSLLIAKEGASLVPGFDLVGVTSVIIFFSALSTSLTLDRTMQVHEFVDRMVPLPLRRTGRLASKYFSLVIELFEPGSVFFHRFQRFTLRILASIALLSIILGFAAYSWQSFGSQVFEFFGSRIPIWGIAEGAALLLMVYALHHMLVEVIYEYRTFVHARALRHMELLRAQGAFFRLGRILGALFLLIALPFILSVLELEASLPVFVSVIILGIILWGLLDLKSDKLGEPKQGKLFFKRP